VDRTVGVAVGGVAFAVGIAVDGVAVGGSRPSSSPPVVRPSDAPRGVYVTRSDTTGMADILAENLSGKAVMGSDGTELGMLYNITMDLKTGALHDLLVTPHEEVPVDTSSFDSDEAGRLKVPVSRVQAVKDYIVIER
jgi:sporulation protein YlmC with PRC-barrel domain